LLTIGGAIITGILIALIFYILQSIAFMKLAKRNNINHSWLAFIPVANTYIFGQIARLKKKLKLLYS